jgi:glutamate N-acetyltransferase/amino-acid N-acetyltransferase
LAVGLSAPEALLPVAGIRWGTACAAIRQSERDDIAVLECSPGTQVASVFTRNRFVAAPVQLARDHLKDQSPRALVVNSGCANAGTGENGYHDAQQICRAVAKQLDVVTEQVLPFSTGVIGERLPVDRMVAGARQCGERLQADGWLHAARAIMTTDSVPKGVSVQAILGGQTVTITGIAKGAGMICPDMATMLAYIATDASVTRTVLQACLEQAVAQSFNRITVDGDTSTNDACIVLATGAVRKPSINTIDHPDYPEFSQALSSVAETLAQAIVRDAEGATKFVELAVTGGESEADCLRVAYTIAHSPLVKTAFYASDPNWGRLLAAVGRSGVPNLDIRKVSIHINNQTVVTGGEVAPTYTEALGQSAMANEELLVSIDLGAGNERAAIWTCDLSNEYVRINAEYRT